MTIRYICRGCRHTLGEFTQMTQELQSSIDALTPEDRIRMIAEDGNGNMDVQVLCEYCQEAIHHHPELSLLSSPLQ